MAATPDSARSRAIFFFAVGIATVLAIGLRAWGVTSQVVIDDEWHALHKLQWSSYSSIFNTFGMADHSIPLTLLYKYIANTIGLAEGRLRILQIICGVALVPACAWIAWGATRDRAVAALFAFLVAGAPFLVMWSRFARPYSISLLLTVLCVASVWRWRGERTRAMAACACLTAALAAWFHPLAGLYAALACIYVFLEDVLRPAPGAARAWRQSFSFGAAVAAAMAALLISPIYHDRQSLSGKSGGDHPNFDTYERMFSVIWGGLPTAAYVAALACAAWGFVVMVRRQPRLAVLLAVLGIFPAIMLTITGAVWMHVATNFLRYQLPLEVIVLFLGSVGAIAAVRAIAGRFSDPMAWAAMFALSVGYLVLNPAIGQVARLGTWYGHTDYHWDYRRWAVYKRASLELAPPDFYRQLGPQAPGTIIEAPYVWEAPYNPLAHYASFHHQNELFGMLHDLCVPGERIGEVPRDRRFRFRRFVFLDNPAAVKASGARYLIFNRGIREHRFAPAGENCVVKLKEIYGPPATQDARVVVWDLQR
jgi:hypothetical protein